MNKYLLLLSGVVLCSCVSRVGREIKDSDVRSIKFGVTTKDDLLRVFGADHQYFEQPSGAASIHKRCGMADDSYSMMIFMYIEGKNYGSSHKTLTVYLDKNDRACSYSRSGGKNSGATLGF